MIPLFQYKYIYNNKEVTRWFYQGPGGEIKFIVGFYLVWILIIIFVVIISYIYIT